MDGGTIEEIPRCHGMRVDCGEADPEVQPDRTEVVGQFAGGEFQRTTTLDLDGDSRVLSMKSVSETCAPEFTRMRAVTAPSASSSWTFEPGLGADVFAGIDLELLE